MEIRFEKTDYDDPDAGATSEFEVDINGPYSSARASVKRSQLKKLHEQLGKLLECKEVPRYMVSNRSSIYVTLRLNVIEGEPDR